MEPCLRQMFADFSRNAGQIYRHEGRRVKRRKLPPSTSLVANIYVSFMFEDNPESALHTTVRPIVQRLSRRSMRGSLAPFESSHGVAYDQRYLR